MFALVNEINTETPQNSTQAQATVQNMEWQRQQRLLLQHVMTLSLQQSASNFYTKALGLPKKYYTIIKCMKITKSSQKCSCCMQQFQKDEVIKRLPCKHIFHKNCIKNWFNVNKTCPICRADVEHLLQQQMQILETVK